MAYDQFTEDGAGDLITDTRTIPSLFQLIRGEAPSAQQITTDEMFYCLHLYRKRIMIYP